MSGTEIKLNLGCGDDIKKGYINIDAIKRNGVDIVMDLSNNDLPYEDNSISDIQLKDILEHFHRNQQDKFLKGCYDKLKVGGTLYVQVPHLEVICKRYLNCLENPTNLQHTLDGEQVANLLFAHSDSENLYNNHKWCFDGKTLVALLERHGFLVMAYGSDGGSNLLCQAIKK